MSGADLEKVHRETVLQALSKNTGKIGQSTLLEEINILKYGAKRTLDKCAKMLAETAFHEAGHAVISKVLMPELRIDICQHGQGKRSGFSCPCLCLTE